MGQLLPGASAYGQANVPADVSNVAAIAAGGYHSLAMVDELLTKSVSQT